MLRVTVELLPGGGELGRRTIAVADIARTRSGPNADYGIELDELNLPSLSAELREYPRWSASVWDLVARAIAVALTGREELPTRPTLPAVPIHHSGSGPYIRLNEIPEPARTFFEHNLQHSTVPLANGDPDPLGCAYASDWEEFLRGER